MTELFGELWAKHGGHLLLVALPMIFFAFVAVRADIRAYRARKGVTKRPQRRIGAAALFAVLLLPAGALAAHLTICPEHVGQVASGHVTGCSHAGCLSGCDC
jgi:hypothetical protein